ncbi:uncharacterized protein LOC129767128 [Toxorhynchites rutilus septentrionalis]|uniref:uncharacterized protein LOC129767128 n=1 Tax=Toxorhynchites rutilus septentrionalis TaxID=329112 RepID=UPI00247ACF23|nr:uncharacterized protein LOC129767128 [Toxorhynchites rutilus septentrionalis]
MSLDPLTQWDRPVLQQPGYESYQGMLSRSTKVGCTIPNVQSSSVEQMQQQCSGLSSSVLLPSLGNQHLQLPTSSLPLAQPGHQQFQVPTSSIFLPPPEHQQYRISNSMVSEPPLGPARSFAPGNQNLRSVRMQPNAHDFSRPRPAGPTAEQLAARQVIPRELPVFSGNPQDWPLFFSSFRNSTEACGYNDAENLARLQRCLRGHALDRVRSRLLIPESVPHVMATLQRLYGRPEIIIMSLLKRMREISSPRGDDLKTLIKFGMGVENLVDHMILADQQQHISNPMLLQELVDRLPSNLKLQWASYKRNYYVVNLATFNDFMKELVMMASEVTLQVDPGMQIPGKYEKCKRENTAKEKLFVHQQAPMVPRPSGSNTALREVASPESKPCLHCDKSDHRIAESPEFKKLSLDDRWKAMRQKGLCRLCLIPHRSWPCRSKRECGIGDCRMRHHPLLHTKKSETITPSPSTPTNRNIAHQHHHSFTSSALSRYLPVTLYGNGKSVNVYAFLDDGSSSTMLEVEVANLLGVKGPSEPMCLCWTGDVKRIEKGSQRVEITISGLSEKTSFPLRARTVEQLKLPSQTVAYDELCEGYPHLRKLPMRGYTDITPQLIIGVDNAKLLSALKSPESGTGELVAVKTRLGWCIYGRCTTAKSPVEYVNAHVEQCAEEAEINSLFRQFLAVDESSIQHSPESEEDKRAMEILQNTTRRVDSRLETGLIWRYNEPCFPNSYPMAVRRMEALERKLAKDPELDEKVRLQIAEYLEKGYAYRITPAEMESTDPRRVWYLPLGVVRNPKKPGKIRLIWDAAARVNGTSFNDMVLKGPDMMTALTTVLLRFRQKRVAFSADIKEMFHQFLIRSRDRQAQRFVFREHPGQPPQIYVMRVATFGAACSPCIAQYLKNKNSKEYANKFPDAARAIIENHYADDYLDSVDSVEEAVNLINEVKYVHSMAGMEIRNFSPNFTEVLTRIGETSKVQQKSLTPTISVERILGMVWRSSEDVFSFELSVKEEIRNIVESQNAPTKRQVLRTIMSLYDPLGLVAHFSVHGKILMQRIWRTSTGWDETISGDLVEEWRRWINTLMKIGEVSVPRCFFSGIVTPKNLQIHFFVDASENAYACVVYIRSLYNGTPRCSLIAAKTKVAPLKPNSIPRLELQAALIGSRLLDNICKSLTITVAARYLWSDSTTVLAWLKSETRRYHQFVGFRVGEILSTTTVSEWRKVQSKFNIADQATKWRDGPSFNPNDWWYTGPAFLMNPDDNWQKDDSEEFSTEEDLRAAFLHHRVLSTPILQYLRFSKWKRFLRSTGFVVRAMKRFLGLHAIGPLSQEELQQAETLIWQQVQQEEYTDELAILRYNKDNPDMESKSVDSTSALYKLSPMLDSDGVLRMNSRIGAAPIVTNEVRFPVLLPKSHRATELLVADYHARFLHSNHETVVNELRQRFYIPQLRVVVRKIAKQCQYCRVHKAVPHPPIMAPLPEIRLTAFVRPFTHTGVDYFGPVFVKQGRSLVKRWIALFTCLSIRAVHLEVVHGLSTQSCVMAIRRFVARRGSPSTFCSDNGTNFIGASNILQEQLKITNEHCAATFTNTNTRWLLNPPLTPHMGGSWERMVRSVKVAMTAISEHPHHPSDEVLETVALEAESVVNSRPLTYIALDHAEQEALTPNHFMFYGTQGVNQPC